MMRRNNEIADMLWTGTNVLIVITLALLVLGAAVLRAAVGQTPTKIEEQKVLCTVGDEHDDKTKDLLCDGFEPNAVAEWPVEWEDYKSKGDVVPAKIVDGKLVPVAPSCAERIKRRADRLVGLHPTLDMVTPADCRDIPARDREAMAKGDIR